MSFEGGKLYISAHDAFHLEKEREFRRLILAAHPDRNHCTWAAGRTRKLLKARKRWEEKEAGWYARFGLEPPKGMSQRCVSRARALIAELTSQNVPMHWHSANETHTVIRGNWTFEHEGMHDQLGPGGFNYIPAKMHHQAWASDDALVFITVDSAWDVNWVSGPPTKANLGKMPDVRQLPADLPAMPWGGLYWPAQDHLATRLLR